MKRIILMAVLLFPFASQGETLLKVGVDPIANSLSDVKMVSVGRHIPLSEHLCLKVDGGHWWDKRRGAKNSFFMDTALGVVIKPAIFDVRIYSGVAGITETDSFLGGNLQFMQEFSFSFQQDGWGIGAAFTHFSSAGLHKPNIGRNFLGLHVIFPL